MQMRDQKWGKFLEGLFRPSQSTSYITQELISKLKPRYLVSVCFYEKRFIGFRYFIWFSFPIDRIIYSQTTMEKICFAFSSFSPQSRNNKPMTIFKLPKVRILWKTYITHFIFFLSQICTK